MLFVRDDMCRRCCIYHCRQLMMLISQNIDFLGNIFVKNSKNAFCYNKIRGFIFKHHIRDNCANLGILCVSIFLNQLNTFREIANINFQSAFLAAFRIP